jgi:purine-nucleoside/S-methyl-5'-thioadenosine phosphorylase / adenosine deaminase
VSGRLELIAAPADGPVRAAFSTRAGGVSEGPWAGLNLGSSTGDARPHVRENRARLCAALGLDPDRVTMGHQVHGTRVRATDAPTRPGRFTGGLSRWPEGDALVTGSPGLPLLVLGADCLSVLLWRRDDDAPRVAAAHAGWRGLLGGILSALAPSVGPPSRLAAAIGPGIGPCCYPVDAVLRDRFAAAFGDEVVRPPAVDLTAAARTALRRAGVPASAIVAVGGCTACEGARFYSHRRDGAVTGRQAGVIWIDPPPSR